MAKKSLHCQQEKNPVFDSWTMLVSCGKFSALPTNRAFPSSKRYAYLKNGVKAEASYWCARYCIKIRKCILILCNDWELMPSILSACSRASLWSCKMIAWDIAASTAFHPVGATAAKWSFWRKPDKEAWSRWRDAWLWVFKNERPTAFSFTLWTLSVTLTVPRSLSIFCSLRSKCIGEP